MGNFNQRESDLRVRQDDTKTEGKVGEGRDVTVSDWTDK